MKSIRRTDIIKTGLILLLILLQRFVFGLQYYPAVDDWFLYLGKDTAMPVLDTRPFAGLFDYYIIAPLSEHLVIIEVLLILMLVFSAYFFYRAFYAKDKPTDTMFILVFTMLPISFEGLYWISAASRIVPSLFFVSLSCFALARYIDSQKRKYFMLYILSGILSVGFYEIFIPVYIAASAVIIISRKKQYWLIIFPIVSGVLMLLYYISNSNAAAISQRFSFVGVGDISSHTVYTIKKYHALFKAGARMMVDAFFDGLQIIIKKPLFAVAIIAATSGLGALSQKAKGEKPAIMLAISLVLISAATALNFVIGFVRLPFRLFVPMVMGVSMLVKTVYDRLLPEAVYKIIVGFLTVVFCICNIGALSVYKETYEKDTELATALMDEFKVTDPETVTYIINAPQYYFDDRTMYYEYVKAAAENYAPITAQIRYISRQRNVSNIICLHENNSVIAFDIKLPYAQYLYYNGIGFEHCKLQETKTGYTVLSKYKAPLGKIMETNGVFSYKNVLP